ncbi:hypothetical protein EB05_02128 [Enterococcus faecium]|uniref:hypothetical protein n=1 Tax=Enterococcus faecium TaxID=1352 RepID=UPI0009360ECF|nr:hypothetical protein [Enterococcus faecium]EMF0264477.1 hypothetical protein [Enterococcus hirae]EKK0903688.1 hypothetical protein [Enterococcus faecium]EME8143300.1 hypothetical protein [Enterococcus faecium]EME8199840.1 hypothetical protein [Enterococcus faecium]EMF0428622.1 hypothetical protein [Enterococcus faecium]
MLYRINLYISSYLPLYLLLIYKGCTEWVNDDESKINPTIYLFFLIILIIFILISIGTVIYFCCQETNRNEPIKGSFTSTGDNVISYIMTYLTPMLSLELKNESTLVINLSLFILIGILYVKNNLVYLNPMLSLFGYYIYEWDYDGTKRIIITNLELSQLNLLSKENEYVHARKFKNNVWLYKK